MFRLTVLLFFLLLFQSTIAQESSREDKFRQLDKELPTPNSYRTASGAPGHEYYQQQADYIVAVTLDDVNQHISGEVTITYTNNSPDPLKYLWLQLDQNRRSRDSDTYKIERQNVSNKEAFSFIDKLSPSFDGGYNIVHVRDTFGNDLPHSIVKTMMRIDLPKTLNSGESYSFKIKYDYKIHDRLKLGGRSGYEYFEDTDNYLYSIAQFFPRMCVYNDVEGWQNKQYLGDGEFALPFGNYMVKITVPADHIVAATGELQNAAEVLTEEQLKLLQKAQTSDKVILIVDQEEAEKKERFKSNDTKTWFFQATNVRDFAFASSRKFIWDAMSVQIGDKRVLAMSFYPKEGNPLWSQFATQVIAHTLRSYSAKTFDYPYPVAQAVSAADMAMEYPMICFNWGRCEPDGTYSLNTKNIMTSVIMHEIGHNFFPMIVNSDERQWAWMDEGINSFLEFLSQLEWDKNHPYARRGYPKDIASYMASDKSKQVPIMTNPESILQLGNNAYAKPATALNILRETILGRELFDFAFKTYAQRWMFKHPTPADFFRTMEDASGTDLDWFWRGWFYTTDHVDISLDKVEWFLIDTQNPEIESEFKKEKRTINDVSLTNLRNLESASEDMVTLKPELKDFYSTYDVLDVTESDKRGYQNYLMTLNEEELKILQSNLNLYELTFSNLGGLPMPIILLFEFVDNSTQEIRIPAEIWRKNHSKITKVFSFEKEVKSVALDPYQETADADMENNFWPPRNIPSKFELYIERKASHENEMQKHQRGQ